MSVGDKDYLIVVAGLCHVVCYIEKVRTRDVSFVVQIEEIGSQHPNSATMFLQGFDYLQDRHWSNLLSGSIGVGQDSCCRAICAWEGHVNGSWWGGRWLCPDFFGFVLTDLLD